jgi:hypothetical protein
MRGEGISAWTDVLKRGRPPAYRRLVGDPTGMQGRENAGQDAASRRCLEIAGCGALWWDKGGRRREGEGVSTARWSGCLGHGGRRTPPSILPATAGYLTRCVDVWVVLRPGGREGVWVVGWVGVGEVMVAGGGTGG